MFESVLVLVSSAQIPNLRVTAPVDPGVGEFPVAPLWEQFNQKALASLFRFECNRQISLWHTDISLKSLHQIFLVLSGMKVDIISDSGM